MTMLLPWVADGLVILGLLVLTISVWGVLRMPDLFRSLHAASMNTALGVGPLLVAAGLRDGTIMARALLVFGFLLLTAPVSSHVIALARRHTEDQAAAGVADAMANDNWVIPSLRATPEARRRRR